MKKIRRPGKLPAEPMSERALAVEAHRAALAKGNPSPLDLEIVRLGLNPAHVLPYSRLSGPLPGVFGNFMQHKPLLPQNAKLGPPIDLLQSVMPEDGKQKSVDQLREEIPHGQNPSQPLIEALAKPALSEQPRGKPKSLGIPKPGG